MLLRNYYARSQLERKGATRQPIPACNPHRNRNHFDMLQEIVKAGLIPPALNGVLLICGLLLLPWYKTVAKLLMLTSIVSLLLLSTDYVASALEGSIEKHPALALDELPRSEALTIVVAGGSHHGAADEYGYPTPTSESMMRLHYASYLHRKTGYPVMLTGGLMNENQIHSKILAESFLNEFKTRAQWLETKSRSTAENAKFGAEILLPLGRKKILLVTHSYHMQRAVKSFQQAGFEVIPAPTIISRTLGMGDWRYWVPGASGLQRSANVIYEYFGLARDAILPQTSVAAELCTDQLPC